jgi:ribose 5-phosphate isomerase B
MTIYFASDHNGVELKSELMIFVREELGETVVDAGPAHVEAEDDYPDYVRAAARAVSKDPQGTRAIVIGKSGQGEAICANRFSRVRTTVFYGNPSVGESFSVLKLGRLDNDANVLALGSAFITSDEAREAVRVWLSAPFSGALRHVRRNIKLDFGE